MASHQQETDAALPPFQPPGIPQYIPPPLLASQTSWPIFPRTYQELLKFQMPLPAPDTSTTRTTAPWSGAQPPPIPLCYSYQDASIPWRALGGLERYLDTHDLWQRPTPNDARTSWRQLQDSYQGLPVTQESWLTSVLTILNLIVTALLKDLGLAHSLLTYDPHLLFSQHGDKDWLATIGLLPDAVEALVEVMDTAGGPTCLPIGPPISPPTIGGGCAFELKLSKVLLEYSHFFAEPFNTFRPLSKTCKGTCHCFQGEQFHWLLLLLQIESPLQLDLQMQNRVIARRVSSYAPRYGIVYTGQYFLLAENVHPLTILSPYSQQHPQTRPFLRGPPLTSPTPGDTRVRGVGVSRIEHIVGGNGPPYPGFLALLVAINARPGMLNIEDPDPQLALPGFTAYNIVYGVKNAQAGSSGESSGTTGSGNSPGKDNTQRFQSWVPPGNHGALVSALMQTTWRTLHPLNKTRLLVKNWLYPDLVTDHLLRVVIFQFELDCFSKEPRTLVEVPQNAIEAALSRHPSSSVSDYCSPALSTAQLLFVDTCIQSGHQTSVYRGRLDGRRVVVKVYEELGFDGLLREVRAYERLLSVPTTPKSLGVFVPSDKAWAVLIVEDKGTSLASDWAAVPLTDREAIYKAVIDVHAAGVYHGDLEVRNLVRDGEGRPSVVDFGHATVDHACEQDVCSELLDLRQDLGL